MYHNDVYRKGRDTDTSLKELPRMIRVMKRQINRKSRARDDRDKGRQFMEAFDPDEPYLFQGGNQAEQTEARFWKRTESQKSPEAVADEERVRKTSQ